MLDYLSNGNSGLPSDPTSNPADDPSLADEFECINYKEFADKFPQNDLLFSVNQDKVACASYLVKFWVDLNYVMEEGVSCLYAVTNM
jgi:hypothetical protein